MGKYIKSSYKNYTLIILISILIPNQIYNDCSICLTILHENYLIDAWGNPFHTKHEKEGVFCNSCSRIISESITQGGYRYNDGRHICSLCQISVVQNESMINSSYLSVISQLNIIGINNLPKNINIELITDFYKAIF